MFRLRTWLWLALAFASAPIVHAAWNDVAWGEPLLQRFTARDMGNHGTAYFVTQHPNTGVIYVGCSGGLVAFDGKSWSTLLTGFAIARLDFDHEGRLWWGGVGDFGYIELSPTAPPHVVSLRDKVPSSAADFHTVWACYPTAGGIYLVTSNSLLRWDGSRFRVWNYPTAVRLFPVRFNNALWFHHLESGLYRIDEDGPKQVAKPAELPDKGLFWLEERDGQLIGASNRGFRSIGPQSKQISPTALGEFTQVHRLTGVVELTARHRALITLSGGISIIDREGNFLRQVPLLGDTQQPFLDRDGQLWVCNAFGLLRFDSAGAVARVPLAREDPQPSIGALAVDPHGAVWIGAINRLFRAAAGSAGLALENVPTTPNNFYTLSARSDGSAVVARFGGIDLARPNRTETICDLSGRSFTALLPLWNPDQFLAVHARGQVQLARDPVSGKWQSTEYQVSLGPVHTLAFDEAHDLWTASFWAPPRRFTWSDGRFVSADAPAVFRNSNGAPSAVIRREHDIIALANRTLFLLRPGREPAKLGSLPGTVSLAALSPDERRLYVVFTRSNSPVGFETGIAALDLSPTGEVQRSRDILVPGLQSIGGITRLAVTREGGTDTLWIGGEGGLMQARPEELPEWSKPSPPRVELAPPTPVDAVFSHDGRPKLRVSSPDITLRPALRFQVSFGPGSPEWGPPADETSFEYSNLREGDYTFAARAINPSGLVSEPVAISFTILPPWYRSVWAYTAYAALFVAALLGAIRIRERRIRARNLELEKQVAERTEELVKANAAKDDFLASMSHEIRNPMNGVVGLSAAIDISHLDEEGRYRFGLLRHCATHLASLLEDILDFSKLQSGTIELDPQPFSPAELLDAVSAITSPVSAAASVKVEFALGPSVPPRLIGDARRIRQVLLNYVSNAIKYAPQGDIDVTVWARIVGEKNAVLTFAVSDAGPGIPLEEQERIFEKFERGAGARSNRIPGTGMGLAVCRRLATKMGGNAWVESAPGEGSTFFLSLELPIAAPVTLDNATQTIVDLPKLALIVDDEDYNLVALATMLERRGFQVLRAANADAALAALAQHPDVVFLDYDMPDTTGPALAKRIRQTTQQRQPLIIATTAYSTVEKRRECLAAGMDGFLSKPIGEERLGSALAEAIQSRSPGDARHFVLPSRDSFDPLENLQTLARQHAQTLEAELAEFSTAARAEFEELHAGLTAEDRQNSARAAHKLAGRFGFLHAAAAMKRALQLERLCQQGNWAAARPLATELTQDWTSLHDTLTRLNCEPA